MPLAKCYILFHIGQIQAENKVNFRSSLWLELCKKSFKEIKELVAINTATVSVLKTQNHCYMEKWLLGQIYTHLCLEHFMSIVAYVVCLQIVLSLLITANKAILKT